jgi:hypothetical protein
VYEGIIVIVRLVGLSRVIENENEKNLVPRFGMIRSRRFFCGCYD